MKSCLIFKHFFISALPASVRELYVNDTHLELLDWPYIWSCGWGLVFWVSICCLIQNYFQQVPAAGVQQAHLL